MLEQGLVKVREISVWIPGRRNPFVHLQDVHCAPGHHLFCQCPEHQPWCAAAAHRQKENTACGRGVPRLCGKNGRRSSGNRFRTRQHFDVHQLVTPL